VPLGHIQRNSCAGVGVSQRVVVNKFFVADCVGNSVESIAFQVVSLPGHVQRAAVAQVWEIKRHGLSRSTKDTHVKGCIVCQKWQTIGEKYSSGRTSSQAGASATSSGLIPCTRMLPSWNQLFGKGGRNNIDSLSDI